MTTNLSNLQKKYKTEILGNFAKEENLNIMEAPIIKKVVVSIGLGESIKNSKILDQGVENLTKITGQKAVTTIAKKSIATFKLREGMAIGAKVTLRDKMAFDFIEKVVNIVLPRVRDFRGISGKSFDQQGNYNFGITEISVFPEINPEQQIASSGVQITVTMSSKSKEHSVKMLKLLGFPFKD